MRLSTYQQRSNKQTIHYPNGLFVVCEQQESSEQVLSVMESLSNSIVLRQTQDKNKYLSSDISYQLFRRKLFFNYNLEEHFLGLNVPPDYSFIDEPLTECLNHHEARWQPLAKAFQTLNQDYAEPGSSLKHLWETKNTLIAEAGLSNSFLKKLYRKMARLVQWNQEEGDSDRYMAFGRRAPHQIFSGACPDKQYSLSWRDFVCQMEAVLEFERGDFNRFTAVIFNWQLQMRFLMQQGMEDFRYVGVVCLLEKPAYRDRNLAQIAQDATAKHLSRIDYVMNGPEFESKYINVRLRYKRRRFNVHLPIVLFVQMFLRSGQFPEAELNKHVFEDWFENYMLPWIRKEELNTSNQECVQLTPGSNVWIPIKFLNNPVIQRAGISGYIQ